VANATKLQVKMILYPQCIPFNWFEYSYEMFEMPRKPSMMLRLLDKIALLKQLAMLRSTTFRSCNQEGIDTLS
jgi:hypothetical protein